MRTLRRLSRRRTAPSIPVSSTAPVPPPLPDIDNELYASTSTMWFARPPQVEELLNNDIYVSVQAKGTKEVEDDDDTYTYITAPPKNNTISTDADVHTPQDDKLLNNDIYVSVVGAKKVEEEDDDTYSYITVPYSPKDTVEESEVKSLDLKENDIYISNSKHPETVKENDIYVSINNNNSTDKIPDKNQVFEVVDYSEPLNLPDTDVEYAQPMLTLRSLGYKTRKFMRKVVKRSDKKRQEQTTSNPEPAPVVEPEIEPEYATIDLIRPKAPTLQVPSGFKSAINELQNILEKENDLENGEAAKPGLPPRLRHRLPEPKLDDILNELECSDLQKKNEDVKNEKLENDEGLSVKRLIEHFDGQTQTVNVSTDLELFPLIIRY